VCVGEDRDGLLQCRGVRIRLASARAGTPDASLSGSTLTLEIVTPSPRMPLIAAPVFGALYGCATADCFAPGAARGDGALGCVLVYAPLHLMFERDLGAPYTMPAVAVTARLSYVAGTLIYVYRLFAGAALPTCKSSSSLRKAANVMTPNRLACVKSTSELRRSRP